MIKGISAVTLATHDMRRAVEFYRLLELPVVHGGEEASFSSFRAGDNFLNLILEPGREWSWWGRLIFYYAESSIMPMSTPSMYGWSPPATGPTTRRATPNGASASSTSPIPTATS
jgi:catechol 2,3-dioxygenase-like lactoylglutathione lyase family enzyme